MRKLKIIHICDKFGVRGSTIHGVTRSFSWWMPRFDARRYDVKLYALKQPDPSSKALEEMGVPLSYLGKSKIGPSILSSFLSLIRNEKPDLLHLHGWISANFGRLAGCIAGVPTIMHEHGVAEGYPRTQQAIDFLLSRFTHTALAISRATRDFLVNKRFIYPSKVRIIYCGVPVDEFRPADPADAAAERERLGIPPKSPVIGTVGRLDVQKGVIYLIRSAKRVLEHIPDARFLIVGDGPEMEKLKREAQEIGVSQSIVFTGHRGDVPLLQTIMDIQVLASLWEAASLTIFEAMAMGKAIVSTGVDGLGEILANGSPAIIVPPGEPASLADAIIRLLQDSALASEYAGRARIASAKYDVNQVVRNLESLYEELCADAGR